ncbi:hypothetical protein Q5762_34490 [Streptomyces sp. P9(2023)]|uniref:hypothetical protein n=1 Tax=Streptomyces sp. P9(2023) TaxID=3064394 RepID=UPI0028F42B5C|nr:hypothetical protein [Streptomyces sp. P9(2023)]MDT9693348.1 hypothetical protein [Streptomyces sp. P9(2023)]
MTDDQKKAIRDLVRQLGEGVREPHYRPAHEAAENICSGVYELIPVEVHDLVHEAALAGYAAALSDLEEGKLDDRVRERFGLLD